MSKENKLIPELRFPEFRDDGEWVYEEINNHIDFLSGIALKSEEISDDNSGTPILRGINITEGHIRHSLEIDKYYLEDITDLKLYLVEENDIVLGMDASKVGKNVALISKHDAGSILIQRVARLRARNSDIAFLYQHFLSERFIRYVDRVNTSSGIPHISAQQIKEFEIGIPPKLQEQQKIAACLSSLDELIAAHNDKLEALKDHKKGLMQNLFPQEGETVPKVRFPEFEGDGEWVEKQLGSVANIVTGSTPSTKEKKYYGGRIMLVSPVDISDNRIITEAKTTLTDIGFSKTRQIEANSVLFVCIGSTIGKVAQNKFKCATNQQINALSAFDGYSNDFLYSLLDCNSSKIAKIAGKHAVPIINKTTFSAIKLPFPPSTQEQQKIASCLSAVDNLITAQQEKIEQLQQHKKGLMQGLFPKIEN